MHGHPAVASALEHVLQQRRPDPSTLERGGDDDLANVEIGGAILDAQVATRLVVTQDDGERGASPVFGEPLILEGGVPRPELPLDHVTVRLVMDLLGEVCVGRSGQAESNHQ